MARIDWSIVVVFKVELRQGFNRMKVDKIRLVRLCWEFHIQGLARVLFFVLLCHIQNMNLTSQASLRPKTNRQVFFPIWNYTKISLGLFHLLFFCRESSFRSIHISLSISLLIDSPSSKKTSDWKDERDETNWMWNTIHDKTGCMKYFFRLLIPACRQSINSSHSSSLCVQQSDESEPNIFSVLSFFPTQLLCKCRRVNNWCFWPHILFFTFVEEEVVN